MGACLGKTEVPDNQHRRNETKTEPTPRRKQIDARVSTWKSTGIIALREASLKAFPPQVFEVGQNARTLDLHGNKISDVPTGICSFTSLQRLVLSNNRISLISSAIGQLSNLKFLDLDSNQLSSIPLEVGNLVRLERLSLQNNKIENLPDSIGNLKKLCQLLVSKNKLISLPPEISGCSSLEELSADDNYIISLPDSLSQLKSIKVLSLDNNNISLLPEMLLQNCSSLQTLSIHGNPISHELIIKLPGFEEFEARRIGKANKQISGNVMIGSKGIDEGFDRNKHNSA